MPKVFDKYDLHDYMAKGQRISLLNMQIKTMARFWFKVGKYFHF